MRPITAWQDYYVDRSYRQAQTRRALAARGAQAPPEMLAGGSGTAVDLGQGAQRGRRRRSLVLLAELFELSLRRMGAKAAAMASALFGPRVAGHFGILTYHRIAPRTAGVPAPRINVTPDRLRAQLRGLLSRGYRAWPLRKVLEHSRTNRTIPAKTFLVTFDDGWECVYQNAWPVLRELRVPATLFMVTAYLDREHPFPFDPWSAAGSSRVPVSSWRPLSTKQCLEMLEDGLIDVGTHSHTHADFRDRPGALRPDLLKSLEVLDKAFGVTEASFAYPYGYGCRRVFGRTFVESVKTTGVLCALTMEANPVAPGSDPFNWGRFHVDSTDTAATLAGKLEGWYSLARKCWLRLRGKASRTQTLLGAEVDQGKGPGARVSSVEGPAD